jgi:hypothetical protein
MWRALVAVVVAAAAAGAAVTKNADGTVTRLLTYGSFTTKVVGLRSFVDTCRR